MSARRSSIAKMREAVVDSFKLAGMASKWKGKSLKKMKHTSEEPMHKKRSLSNWRNYQTISWRVDEQKDASELRNKSVSKSATKKDHWRAKLLVAWHFGVSWVVPGMIGIITAISGHYIEIGVNHLNKLRFGVCTDWQIPDREKCLAPAHWVSWDDVIPGFAFSGILFYTIVSIVLATLSSCLVMGFAPMAKGSGIPEVKTILGGFCMNEALEFKTLVVKIIGLTLSVSAGLSLGKEGPLVHVACCWSNFLAKFSSRYRLNESNRRALISTAAAAGVSVAFGAPLGGVLFSFEEVSTMFPTRTMIRAFFAAAVAALSLGVLSALGTEHPGKLTMFETKYDVGPHYTEYPFFLLLGIIGGLVGANFVHWNIKISSNRADGTPWRRRIPTVLEVAIIALITGITSFPNKYTAQMSSETIRSLFHACNDPKRPDMMGLCDGEHPRLDTELMWILLGASLIRYFQMTITFGTGVPCGLFVPSLFTGATIGRAFGMAVRSFHLYFGFESSTDINPGIYSMLGAAAVLGGVCRVTISLVVIMFELTGGLQMIVPFMLSVLTAKQVGDAFTGGIYDCCIKLRGYPYLHEPDDVTFTSRACDIMDSDLDCITLEPTTMDELLASLQEAPFTGLPLVESEDTPKLIGFIFKKELIEWIENEKRDNAFVSGTSQVAFKKWHPDGRKVKGIDLSEHVDLAIMRVVPETPLAQVHNIFRQLGVKTLLVTKFGVLEGMITKKLYLDLLAKGQIGHVSDDPAIHCHHEKAHLEGKHPSAVQTIECPNATFRQSLSMKKTPSATKTLRTTVSKTPMAIHLHGPHEHSGDEWDVEDLETPLLDSPEKKA